MPASGLRAKRPVEPPGAHAPGWLGRTGTRALAAGGFPLEHFPSALPERLSPRTKPKSVRSVEFMRERAPKTGPTRPKHAAPVGVIFRWNRCSKYKVLCSIFIFYMEGIYVGVAMQFTREWQRKTDTSFSGFAEFLRKITLTDKPKGFYTGMSQEHLWR